MEIEEGVIAEADNTLRDLHNSSYDTPYSQMADTREKTGA